jgi:hypothetical protein
MWSLHLSHGHVIRFKSMKDAIAHAENNNLVGCTIEGPALSEQDIFMALSEVEAAGFEISSDCFLASFDGKVN